MRVGYRWGTRVVAAVVLSAATIACYATHEYRQIKETSQVPSPRPAALPVRVALPAGAARIGRAAPDLMYDLRMRICTSHFVPRVGHGADGTPALEVGIRRRPDPGTAFSADEERNVVDLLLGQEVPIDLRLDLGAGRHEAALGGLRLAALAVACGSGGLTVGFDEPTLLDPEQITLDAGTGRLTVRRLGNASPGFVAVRGGSGVIDVDLSGSWRRDAQIQIDVRLADVRLEVPRGLAVDLHAVGRDPGDLDLPEFNPGAAGHLLAPGYRADAAHRISVQIGPGIGRIEAHVSG